MHVYTASSLPSTETWVSGSVFPLWLSIQGDLGLFQRLSRKQESGKNRSFPSTKKTITNPTDLVKSWKSLRFPKLWSGRQTCPDIDLKVILAHKLRTVSSDPHVRYLLINRIIVFAKLKIILWKIIVKKFTRFRKQINVLILKKASLIFA